MKRFIFLIAGLVLTLSCQATLVSECNDLDGRNIALGDTLEPLSSCLFFVNNSEINITNACKSLAWGLTNSARNSLDNAINFLNDASNRRVCKKKRDRDQVKTLRNDVTAFRNSF